MKIVPPANVSDRWRSFSLYYSFHQRSFGHLEYQLELLQNYLNFVSDLFSRSDTNIFSLVKFYYIMRFLINEASLMYGGCIIFFLPGEIFDHHYRYSYFSPNSVVYQMLI